MPVPLTTAALAFGFLLAFLGADIVAAVIGGLGVLNQLFVSYSLLKAEL